MKALTGGQVNKDRGKRVWRGTVKKEAGSAVGKGTNELVTQWIQLDQTKMKTGENKNNKFPFHGSR